MKRLPADVEASCIGLLQQNTSYGDISGRLGISEAIITKLKRRGETMVGKKKPGLQQMIKPNLRRLLVRQV